jgi:Nucleoside 2-deoxyribosyltransferase like
MTEVITAPEHIHVTDTPSLFLAGGITNCPDWQHTAVLGLGGLPITLLNPRRPDFPMGDPEAGIIQIEWEFMALGWADAVLFWFPEETLCPITLYELGAQNMGDKPLFVGTHPDYERKLDVAVQTRLARPGVEIHSTLSGTLKAARRWVES